MYTLMDHNLEIKRLHTYLGVEISLMAAIFDFTFFHHSSLGATHNFYSFAITKNVASTFFVHRGFIIQVHLKN